MLSIRRVFRVGGAAILLLSGLVVGVLSSSPTASASGSVWSIVPSPNTSPTQINQLNAVSCSGPSACVAVGIYATPEANPPYNTPPQTLIESWNGSAWSIVPSPDTSSTLDNALSAVSCSNPSACVAVGGRNRRQRPCADPDRVLERVGLVDRPQPQHLGQPGRRAQRGVV